MRKLLNQQATFDVIQKKESRVQVRAKNVLETFEYIVETAENAKFDEEFFEKASMHIKYISRRLKLSPVQTVLLALFVDRSKDNSIRISEIASHTGCRTTKILRFLSEINMLEEKHYLRDSRSRNSLSYRMLSDVLKVLKKNQPYIYKMKPITDLQTFFGRFNYLMEEMNDDEITHNALLSSTNTYLAEIKDSYFAQNLKGFELEEENSLLFIYVAHLFVENDDDRIGFYDRNNLYDNNKMHCQCHIVRS